MRRSAALAGVVLLAGLVPAVPATAAKPTHVAIVIAGHGVACVPWHSGITGDQVLNEVATVKYRPTDGLITQIDGQPKNNRADETHYWSYWHNTGTGWKYATAGASSYLPRAGTVEGWHFINGSSTATPPPVRSYASICHETVVVAPVVPPTSSAAPSATHATHATHATQAAPSPTAPAERAGPSRTAATTASASVSGSRPPGTSTARTAAAAAAPAADLPTLRARNTADATHHSGEGSAVPTVLVVAIVLVLGGIAALLAHRRRRLT